MKVLSIMGSPHGMKGNTGRLLEEVLAGVKQLPDKCQDIGYPDVSRHRLLHHHSGGQ